MMDKGNNDQTAEPRKMREDPDSDFCLPCLTGINPPHDGLACLAAGLSIPLRVVTD